MTVPGPDESQDPLAYYRRHGRITDPREEGGMLANLPLETDALRDVVQGLMVHIFWAQRHGLTLSPERQKEVQLRYVSDKLKQIRRLDGRPLVEPRPVEKRLVGNCRDISVMLCAMLRQQGVPARARCGFATYFLPNHFEDHWVCELWPGSRRWVMVDAQLDALQRKILGIDFDPLDVPHDRFLTGGKAWQMCRAGKADPDAFGISDLHGLWFVRGNLVRDLAALNKVELLPWDTWGLIEGRDHDISRRDLSLLDRAAALCQPNNDEFEEARSLYEGSEKLRVPRTIRTHLRTGVETVEL